MLVQLLSAAVILLAIVGIARYRRRRSPASRLRRTLAAASEAWLQDLVIPEDVDGHIHIEHLLRTRAGFIVVDITRVDGAVFGADNTDEWTVIHAGQSKKFRNPVQPNRNRVLAVRHLTPAVPIHGLVVLLGQVVFPKGQPEGVVSLDGLAGALDDLPQRQDRSAWDEAWIGLAACARDATIRP